MKKVLAINSVPYGSTAKIMQELALISNSKGFEVKISSGYSYHPINEIRNLSEEKHICIGNIMSKAFHMCMSKLLGNHGCYSRISTRKFIKKIKEFSPDIIHLHNIHGWYLNVPMLFNYIKQSKIPVIWTLHDCWAFTGGCAHFTFCRCNKWVDGCGECNNLKEYPILSSVDRTKKMWKMKKECFCGLNNLTIVTPSQWLAELTKQTYFKKYPIQIINNGINLKVFKEITSRFREKYDIAKEQNMVLGVSLGWNERKGLDVFIELAKILPKNYQIVLVGTDNKTDVQLPNNIISIHRTQNQQELAEIYSAADVFVNPTREENYPTVNMEALACGTPVLTFSTGGSPEMIDDTCGCIVDCDDFDSLKKEIIRICEQKPYSVEQCVKKAKEFDQNKRFKEYLNLYETIIATSN